MSLIFATQLTAVATAALGVFAIVTAVFAFLAYRKQAQEVGLLLKENEREAVERRRAQAERVFVGAPQSPGRVVSPYAMNASDLPVFGTQLWFIDSGSLSDPEDLGVILPGDQPGTDARAFDDAEDALAHTILTFRDATSRRWVRLTDGRRSDEHRAARKPALSVQRKRRDYPARTTIPPRDLQR
jgi:hypothetical protein